MKKIGFMGGTFSPPHLGHLHSAKVFIEEMGLDRLIIIPAKVSPFKVDIEATASDRERLDMAKLCFENLNSEKCTVEISDMELKKDQTSYTVETAAALKEKYPDAQLYMFVGSDMFLSLERWKEFRKIFEICHVYTRCRNENEGKLMKNTVLHYEKNYSARVFLSHDKEIIVSSTYLREALACRNDEICKNLLTCEVFRYIIERRLYF